MKIILTINSGSSSLKACLFTREGERRSFRYEGLGDNHPAAFDALISDLGGALPDAIGHRFVHGGDVNDAARLLDAEEFARLEGIVLLAPLHMPGNLHGARLCGERFNAPQVACFDTAFHTTLPEIAQRLPIPREYGLRRYGFHGLNYAHVAHSLPALIGDAARGRIIVAHLGSGASLCLLDDLKSVDTTMGYTPAGGIVMATRSGDLDPGVMLELATRHDTSELSNLVYHNMGLIALSEGESGDMAALLESGSKPARLAVDIFCREVRAAIGALAAKAGGVDALVFTAGIGEHAANVRATICEPLGFLGFKLDSAANRAHATRIEAGDTKPILIVPADEETVIRDLTGVLTSPAR